MQPQGCKTIEQPANNAEWIVAKQARPSMAFHCRALILLFQRLTNNPTQILMDTKCSVLVVLHPSYSNIRFPLSQTLSWENQACLSLIPSEVFKLDSLLYGALCNSMIFSHRKLYQSTQYSISNSLQWETTQLYIAIRERVVTFQSHPKQIFTDL